MQWLGVERDVQGGGRGQALGATVAGKKTHDMQAAILHIPSTTANLHATPPPCKLVTPPPIPFAPFPPTSSACCLADFLGSGLKCRSLRARSSMVCV